MVLGKIAIVIGSGIVGTLVTGGDAGKLPDLRDVLSVSFKFMTKQDKKEGSSAAVSSPHTDQLLSQVNYLREQLRVLSDQKEMPNIIINGRPGVSICVHQDEERYLLLLLPSVGYPQPKREGSSRLLAMLEEAQQRASSTSTCLWIYHEQQQHMCSLT